MSTYCGIKLDGTIVCGENSYVGPPSAGKYIKLDLGRYHACALSLDNTVSCWGNTSYGQLNAPTGTFVEISVGEMHSCALGTDGRLLCWGDDYNGALSPLSFSPTDLRLAQLNTYYDQTITIAGGYAPYSYVVASGSLPSGLELANGYIIGVPTTFGKSTFSIQVTDAAGFTGDKTYMISVNPPVFLPAIY